MSSLPPRRAGRPYLPDGSGFLSLGAGGGISPAARWGGRTEVREDLHAAGVLAGGLLLCGLPAGLLWWWLAPRADFRITPDGPVAIGRPVQELAVSDDSVFVLVLVGLGLLAGGLAWALRRRRGVAVVAALALGTGAAAVVAWQLGELLGPPPTEAELADVGRVVTTPVRLSAVPALAAAPFSAVLAYLVGTLVTRGDDLGRPAARRNQPSAAVAGDEPAGEDAAGEEAVDAGAR